MVTGALLVPLVAFAAVSVVVSATAQVAAHSASVPNSEVMGRGTQARTTSGNDMSVPLVTPRWPTLTCPDIGRNVSPFAPAPLHAQESTPPTDPPASPPTHTTPASG